MFKKRNRPAGVREKAKEEAPVEVKTEDETGEAEGIDEDAARTVEELIMMRKLRKARQGIDLEKLNRGEEKRKKKEEKRPEQKYGLQTRKEEDVDEELEGEDARAKRLVRSNNFTQQTNALDVDKHMLAYIEEELKKRRGNVAKEGEEVAKPYDPQAELYKIPEKYLMQPKAKTDDEEGNVTNSLGMLTAIPEVDLGMDNRLRNIELTEKAKREMMEQRQAAQKRQPEEEDYSAARFYRSNLRTASDIYAARDARREAIQEKEADRQRREPRHESATDEQVYERFKKRMKR